MEDCINCKEDKMVMKCTSSDPELREGLITFCRICYNESEEESLLSPCNCAGSIKYVHQSCLLKWLKARKPVCELCKYNYQIIKKTRQYEKVCI